MGQSKVAVVRTTPETVLADIDRLCELAGLRAALDSKASTIIKDEGFWHQPFPSAHTTPWQFEGAVLALKSRGFEELSLVKSSSVLARPQKSEKVTQSTPLCEKYNIPVLYNFKSRDMKWVEYRPKAQLLVLQNVLSKGMFLPDYFFGKNVMHLPTLKCHVQVTASGAMANALHGLLRARHHAPSWIHRMLVDVLALQQEIHSGLFAIMDGTTAGSGPGPVGLVPVTKNVLLASTDQVAIDAVAAKVMGFEPMGIEYIRLAHERGLGTGDPRDIEIVGADALDQDFRFSPGNNRKKHLVVQGSTALSSLLYKTPLTNLLTLGSAYQRYRGRRRNRAIFEEWRRTNSWGQLFEAYALGQSDRIVGGSGRG